MRIVLEKGFNWKFRGVFACFREPGLWAESPQHLGPLVEEGSEEINPNPPFATVAAMLQYRATVPSPCCSSSPRRHPACSCCRPWCSPLPAIGGRSKAREGDQLRGARSSTFCDSTRVTSRVLRWLMCIRCVYEFVR